jgi:transposase
MQRAFSKEFKVAMEAIRGDLTIAEIISKYQVSNTAIHKWKRLVLENGLSIFRQKKKYNQRNKLSNCIKLSVN